jgi:4-oxalocrotonate tautomerase
MPGKVNRRADRTKRSGSASRISKRRNSKFTEEAPMPLIQVKVIEGVFTEAQKRDIVRKLTDAMVSIEGENMRPVTWVTVEEVKSGDWGIGGKPLTTADVKALAASKPTG